MKLYLAGIYTSNMNLQGNIFHRLDEREQAARLELPYILESYHYIHKETVVRKIRQDGTKIFLDSGAFSAFTKGVDVNLNKYCAYIKDKQDIIKFASVLDAIGDAQGTFANQIEMERQGVQPLPCFHYGEDTRYLDYYVANYEYVTIGGMVPISTPQLLLWLDRIWEHHLTDGAGRPLIKIHGFGLTAPSLMKRYPWYSVDSSSWVQAAANGLIVLPWNGAKFAVSSNSSARHNHNQHLDTIPDDLRIALTKRIEEFGFSMERLQTQYMARWIFNCWAFKQLSELLLEGDPKFHMEQMGLF